MNDNSSDDEYLDAFGSFNKYSKENKDFLSNSEFNSFVCKIPCRKKISHYYNKYFEKNGISDPRGMNYKEFQIAYESVMKTFKSANNEKDAMREY